MVVLGCGMGMIIRVMVIAVQNAVPHCDLGTATGAKTFVREIGSAFGVAVFSAIFNNRLAANLQQLLPARASAKQIGAGTITASPAALRLLPPDIENAVLESIARATHVVFLAGIPLVLAAFCLSWLLRKVPLREQAHVGALESQATSIQENTDAVHVGAAGPSSSQ